MIIGVPKEIKDDEYRVGMMTVGVHLLKQDGHALSLLRKMLALEVDSQMHNT